MSDVNERPPMQIHKGRWVSKKWSGTPSDIARAAEKASDLVGQKASPPRMRISVTASASDSTFFTSQQLLEDLETRDLQDLNMIRVSVASPVASAGTSRIVIAFQQASASSSGEPASPAVRVNVTGPDRDWVELATLRMRECVGLRAEWFDRVAKIGAAVVVALGLSALLTVIVGGNNREGRNASEEAALWLAVTAGVVFLVLVLASSLDRRFELIPEGGLTKWQRLQQRAAASGRFVGSKTLTAAIAAIVGGVVAKLLF